MEFDRSLDVPEPVAYVVAWFLIVLIHELGHLLTAVLLGIKNNLFSVGPFRVRVLNGRYHFDCSFKHFNALGGLVAPYPKQSKGYRWKMIAVYAAGPLANLITGVVVVYASGLSFFEGDPFRGKLIFGLIIGSFFCAIYNLVPFWKIQNGICLKSDGYQIREHLSPEHDGPVLREINHFGAFAASDGDIERFDVRPMEVACEECEHSKHHCFAYGAIYLHKTFSDHPDAKKYAEKMVHAVRGDELKDPYVLNFLSFCWSHSVLFEENFGDARKMADKLEEALDILDENEEKIPKGIILAFRTAFSVAEHEGSDLRKIYDNFLTQKEVLECKGEETDLCELGLAILLADQGDVDAAYNVAVMYYNGVVGEPPDYVQAYVWCSLAEDMGSEMASDFKAEYLEKNMAKEQIVEAVCQYLEMSPNEEEDGEIDSSFDPETWKPDDLFTPRAQQVLALARLEANRFNHNYVGTEHLLLGLIKLGQGVAVNVLQKIGFDLQAVRLEVEKNVRTRGEQKNGGNIPYTPRVKKVLNLASKEKEQLQHSYVGTEHILLGLLIEGDGVAARVLKNLDIDIENVRQEILKELDPHLGGAGGAPGGGKEVGGKAGGVAESASSRSDALPKMPKETSVESKFCHQCGQSVQPSDKFCAKCGASIRKI